MFVELKEGKLKVLNTNYEEIELTEAEQTQLKAILTNKSSARVMRVFCATIT